MDETWNSTLDFKKKVRASQMTRGAPFTNTYTRTSHAIFNWTIFQNNWETTASFDISGIAIFSLFYTLIHPAAGKYASPLWLYVLDAQALYTSHTATKTVTTAFQ